MQKKATKEQILVAIILWVSLIYITALLQSAHLGRNAKFLLTLVSRTALCASRQQLNCVQFACSPSDNLRQPNGASRALQLIATLQQ